MVAHGVITVLLLAHFQWIFFLLNAPLLGWLVYRWVNLVFFKVYMTDIFFICSMEATWYFDMEIQKIKWDIVVFSLHFSHLKTLNFTSVVSETAEGKDLGLVWLWHQNKNVGLLTFHRCLKFWTKIGIMLECLIYDIFHLFFSFLFDYVCSKNFLTQLEVKFYIFTWLHSEKTMISNFIFWFPYHDIKPIVSVVDT